jgi:Protein of unknown function (DUF2009)
MASEAPEDPLYPIALAAEESLGEAVNEEPLLQGIDDAPDAVAAVVTATMKNPTKKHHISRATYPLPHPLSLRLKAGMLLTTTARSTAATDEAPVATSTTPTDGATVEVAASSSSSFTTPQRPRSRPLVETFPEALAQLVGNSIEALDDMYFSTHPRLRKHENFQHRLCLRIKTNVAQKSLSITDLGVGMTRADLINSLGIGRANLTTTTTSTTTAVPSRANGDTDTDDDADNDEKVAAASSSTVASNDPTDSTEEEEMDENDKDSATSYEYEDDDDDASHKSEQGGTEEQEEGEEDNDEDDDDDEDEEEEEPAAKQKNGSKRRSPAATADAEIPPEKLPCRATDIGGFYAALCALGTGVRVGTKSKFDDYYEFEVGLLDSANAATPSPDHHVLDEFCITRPREEGLQLTVEHGFDQFQNVRGESGTCVTIRLNEQAIAAGLLDEDKLKPMFLKIVETTQYTVAFSTDGQAQDIIDASAKDMATVAEMESKDSTMNEDPLEAVAEMDIGSSSLGRQEAAAAAVGSHNSVKERAKYIPLRLTLGERKMLRLVEASMVCCEYTTDIDRAFKSKARRTHEQLKGVTSVMRGLVTACDYVAGQRLLQDDDYAEYQVFFRQMFEIARRHKIMNPEKLQDAVSPAVRAHLGFSVKGPIESVYKFLEERDGLGVLSDPFIETATEEILAGKKSRAAIDKEIKNKERAVKIIKTKYRSNKLSVDDIHVCLYSISDNNSFLNSNRVPVDKIIDYLTSHFAPDKIETGYSLSIVRGEDGARLSHSHERQYYFALQSLTLWRDIIDDMFRLWAMAEEDLLSESVTYSLQDTGQGMQRVQQSPRTYQAMQTILSRVQSKVHKWVGSSVIHMGDHNVPNSLSFIDKYTQGKESVTPECMAQKELHKLMSNSISLSSAIFCFLVPRILGPIVSCLENLEKICEKDAGINRMVNDGFGGVDKLRQDILYDFFRSAFDGSGADNFYDAGSCIDGRMTSAWNWCSQLPEKPFYPIFKLTGFIGFDGEFK